MDVSTTTSQLERKLQAKWMCFQDLSRILTKITSHNVLTTGIFDVRSDAVIPNEYLDELSSIKDRLFVFGGKYRSRTERKTNLKEICDLWRRVGEDIVNRIPENQCSPKNKIGMTIKKITVGRRCNNKRIQKNTYTYNWLNNENCTSV